MGVIELLRMIDVGAMEPVYRQNTDFILRIWIQGMAPYEGTFGGNVTGFVTREGTLHLHCPVLVPPVQPGVPPPPVAMDVRVPPRFPAVDPQVRLISAATGQPFPRGALAGVLHPAGHAAINPNDYTIDLKRLSPDLPLVARGQQVPPLQNLLWAVASAVGEAAAAARGGAPPPPPPMAHHHHHHHHHLHHHTQFAAGFPQNMAHRGHQQPPPPPPPAAHFSDPYQSRMGENSSNNNGRSAQPGSVVTGSVIGAVPPPPVGAPPPPPVALGYLAATTTTTPAAIGRDSSSSSSGGSPPFGSGVSGAGTSDMSVAAVAAMHGIPVATAASSYAVSPASPMLAHGDSNNSSTGTPPIVAMAGAASGAVNAGRRGVNLDDLFVSGPAATDATAPPPARADTSVFTPGTTNPSTPVIVTTASSAAPASPPSNSGNRSAPTTTTTTPMTGNLSVDVYTACASRVRDFLEQREQALKVLGHLQGSQDTLQRLSKSLDDKRTTLGETLKEVAAMQQLCEQVVRARPASALKCIEASDPLSAQGFTLLAEVQACDDVMEALEKRLRAPRRAGSAATAAAMGSASVASVGSSLLGPSASVAGAGSGGLDRDGETPVASYLRAVAHLARRQFMAKFLLRKVQGKRLASRNLQSLVNRFDLDPSVVRAVLESNAFDAAATAARLKEMTGK